MSGHHAHTPALRALYKMAAVAVTALAVAGATALSPAEATPAPVVVTMGVTGATSSNCGALSLGGSDVWVAPGGELDFKTTVVGLNLVGLKIGLIDVSSVANLSGKLTIVDSGKTYSLDASKSTPVTPLTTGDHRYTFAFDKVTLLGGLLPLTVSLSSLPTGALGAGVTLTYNGTIHVTSDAANCGVAVQLPGPVVSASVPGLPPVVVSVPPVGVTVLPSVPLSLPGQSSPAGPGGGSSPPGSTGAPGSPGGSSVPTSVVASSAGGFAPVVGGGGFPGAPGDRGSARPSDVGFTGVLIGASPAAARVAPGARGHTEESLGGGSAISQPPVLLAILATMAFALVTAAYARRYLLLDELPRARPAHRL